MALYEIFANQRYADKVLEYLFKQNKNAGSNDRALIAECTYDIVRYWRLLNEASENNYKTDRVSLLNVVSAYLFLFKNQKTHWLENQNFDFDKLHNTYQTIKNNFVTAASIPDELNEIATREMGEKWQVEMHAMNEKANLTIRVNTLKANKNTLQEILSKQHIITQDGKLSKEALILNERQNIFLNEYFKKGFFEVQDEGSQTIAPFLEVEPGMRVIDACAGAGGKTLHLAALMQNKGRIIALDIEEMKLNELKKRAARAGVSIIEVKKITTSKIIKRLHNSADRLLLDVPCSGLGVLKRNPDAKWKINREKLNELLKTQELILQQYSKMLKRGGKMVYATCSLLPSENELQIKNFLANNHGFSFLKEQYIYPSIHNCDGFYMALLQRQY
jgi:16S rRNA (cytosine967-C5)-methyltransferase